MKTAWIRRNKYKPHLLYDSYGYVQRGIIHINFVMHGSLSMIFSPQICNIKWKNQSKTDHPEGLLYTYYVVHKPLVGTTFAGSVIITW